MPKTERTEEYVVKSMLRRLGYERIFRTESGILVAEGSDGNHMMRADLKSGIFQDLDAGETLNLRKKADFTRCFFREYTDDERRKLDENVMKSVKDAKAENEEAGLHHLADYCMGRLMATVAIGRTWISYGKFDWRVEASFSITSPCSGCGRLFGAEENLNYFKRELARLSSTVVMGGSPIVIGFSHSSRSGQKDGEPVAVVKSSSKKLEIGIKDVPDDESFFSFIKERLDGFLPELEYEFYDESQEEFSPAVLYQTIC